MNRDGPQDEDIWAAEPSVLYEELERRFIAMHKETDGVGRALDSDGPQENHESVDASALSAAVDDR